VKTSVREGGSDFDRARQVNVADANRFQC